MVMAARAMMMVAMRMGMPVIMSVIVLIMIMVVIMMTVGVSGVIVRHGPTSHQGRAGSMPARTQSGPLAQAASSSSSSSTPAMAAIDSLRRALARTFSLSLFSCPQAARMSRPRGVRIGEE